MSQELISRLSSTSIAVVGDFFLDEYVHCEVLGVSPEMPVLRLVRRHTDRAAGAAGNLAANLRALGARVSCIGVTGADERSERLVELLAERGMETHGLVRDSSVATVAVTRFLSSEDGRQHHHLRVDSGGNASAPRSAVERMLAQLREGVRDVQALFIADYDESPDARLLGGADLQEIIRIARDARVRVFGTSRRRVAELAGVDVLLCNAAEAAQLGIDVSGEFEAAAAAAMRRHRFGTLCVTRGEHGAACATGGEVIPLSPRASREVDPCGAGDSFAATFALGLTSGLSEKEAGELAVLAGGLAVERAGTAPVSASDLAAGLLPASTAARGKFLPLGELAARLPALREGRRVVFTNGCFDVFHSGHVQFLRRARELGDLLIVALNSDRSTRANKGPGRPVLPESERVEIISSIESVDLVTLFDDLTPISAITALQPDVLAKGGNYELDEVVGKSLVEAAGGRVVVIPQTGSFVTSDFIRAVSAASSGERDE